MKNTMVKGIKAAFDDLKVQDGYLFDCPIEETAEHDARKLHEVCINHRLSNHLESHLQEVVENANDPVFFDIEFNREGGSHKELNVNDHIQVVRPDIIVHNRKSGGDKRNIMVVECKKEGAGQQSLNEDKQKIIAFMNSETYLYEFGLQVIYGTQNISGTFFYRNQNEIIEEQISS